MLTTLLAIGAASIVAAGAPVAAGGAPVAAPSPDIAGLPAFEGRSESIRGHLEERIVQSGRARRLAGDPDRQHPDHYCPVQVVR